MLPGAALGLSIALVLNPQCQLVQPLETLSPVTFDIIPRILQPPQHYIHIINTGKHPPPIHTGTPVKVVPPYANGLHTAGTGVDQLQGVVREGEQAGVGGDHLLGHLGVAAQQRDRVGGGAVHAQLGARHEDRLLVRLQEQAVGLAQGGGLAAQGGPRRSEWGRWQRSGQETQLGAQQVHAALDLEEVYEVQQLASIKVIGKGVLSDLMERIVAIIYLVLVDTHSLVHNTQLTRSFLPFPNPGLEPATQFPITPHLDHAHARLDSHQSNLVPGDQQHMPPTSHQLHSLGRAHLHPPLLPNLPLCNLVHCQFALPKQHHNVPWDRLHICYILELADIFNPGRNVGLAGVRPLLGMVLGLSDHLVALPMVRACKRAGVIAALAGPDVQQGGQAGRRGQIGDRLVGQQLAQRHHEGGLLCQPDRWQRL